MRTIHAAILVACTVGALAIAPVFSVTSAAKGLGGHPSGGFRSSATGLSRPLFRPWLFRNFSRWPLAGYSQWPRYGGFYGGYVATSPDGSEAVSYVMPERVIYVPLPPQALTCKHSVEKVTVPSSLGGTREITVTRC